MLQTWCSQSCSTNTFVINYLIIRWVILCKNIFKTLPNPKSWEPEILKRCSPPVCQVTHVRFQVSGVRCQVSDVRCQVSGVTFTPKARELKFLEKFHLPCLSCVMSHVSHVTCHVSHVTIFFSSRQSVKSSLLRVCHQFWCAIYVLIVW